MRHWRRSGSRNGGGRRGEAALVEHAQGIEGDQGDLSRWAEPYALLAGRVKDPDALVKALVGANRELGLRALATAQGLREETVAEVLELSEEWKERSKVYPQIPELVGDGERALKLLNRLRRTTRNGNDLFFLDLAVREVGKRWPDHARGAEDLRGCLFNHIPAPPDEDLFRWVETPKDGRVGLWREVPEGKFWMGRPKEEEGDDDELPRHEVTFTEGFKIAAVPVTNAQFRAFDPGHRWMTWESVSEEELAHHPVVEVTWYQAVSFCRWLSATFPELRGARLPTEEEWEYACRAGRETAYWKGNGEKSLAKVGWFSGNSGGRTHRVGELEANEWGLYDVHGNVWEWNLDKWDSGRYQGREKGIRCAPSAIEADEYADPSGGWRVIRGGSYGLDAGRARSAYRHSWDPDWGLPYLGFRVVVPVAPSDR